MNMDTNKVFECGVKGSAYGGIDTVLAEGAIYALKGRLLALNKKKLQVFYYEPDTTVHVSTSEFFKSTLTNKASVTGLGLIVSREVKKLTPEKENVTIIMRHSDFNPDPLVCILEALCLMNVSWSPLMVKLQPLLVPNREALLTGRIIGYSPSRHMWSVEVFGVNITTGHETNAPSSLPVPGSQLVTPGGRARGKLYIPEGDEGETPVAVSSPVSKGKNKNVAASPTPRQYNKKLRGNPPVEDSLIDP
ncbi:hypothetical protein DFH28DRAFT_1138432 [Melampsora americana]|nr:hypothetical protein DFH28DRAFT_1138432 [Melampsora americana]